MDKDHINGEIAVLKVELEANKKGLLVSYPRSQHLRYDMLLDDGIKIYRTQIKYLNGFNFNEYGKSKNCLRLRLSGNNKPYDKKDIDLLLIYLPSKDVIVSIPIDQFHMKKSISININQPKSNRYYKNFLW